MLADARQVGRADTNPQTAPMLFPDTGTVTGFVDVGVFFAVNIQDFQPIPAIFDRQDTQSSETVCAEIGFRGAFQCMDFGIVFRTQCVGESP